MLREQDVEILITRAVEERDKRRREGHDETGEWWDGYRTALQLVLGDTIPKSIRVAQCKSCGGRRWLLPLSWDDPEDVPCPMCNSDGKLGFDE